MEEQLTIQMLVKANYSGAMSDMSTYMNLAIQTGAVLVGGIVLWRMSNRIHKKREQRKRNSYFETPYSKGWKRK